MPLVVNRFPSEREAMSDIELCTSIQSSSNKKSIFYKNTLEVVPNVGRVYGTGLPMMYYYLETYNLADGTGKRPDVTLRLTVVDATGKEVLRKEKSKPRLHRSSVEIGTMNLSALRGGTYLLKASMIDTGQHALAVTTKKFFIYRPGMAPDTTTAAFNASGATSEFSVMTEQEIDLLFKQASYLATQLERDQYPKLSGVEAKRNFLFEFWRRRDTDPVTPFNEFKDAYYRRVEFANATYAVGSREGWKTDRGRVYLVYGQSDEIERFPSTAESLPYEIWHYNALQGGVIFVFVDRTGLSDYQLVHSTHRDELQDGNWFERWAHKAQ
jgi:GWxTD domain-containing protein